MDLKSSVISGLKWSSSAKLGTQIISWAITIYVMRILTPEDYGLLAMAAVFVSLCLLLNEMGLSSALIQIKTINERILRQAFGLVILLNGFLLVILLSVSGLIANLYNEPRLTEIIPVLALQFPIMMFFAIPSSMLQREMNFKAISIVAIYSEVAGGLCTLFLAWTGYGIWSLVIGSLARALVQSIVINIYYPFLKLPNFNFRGFAEAAKYGGYISLQRVLWYLYSQADVFIVGKALGTTVLGYYSVALHISSLPLQKFGMIFNQVGLPAYSKIQGNLSLVSQYALKVVRLIGIIAIPLFWGISSVAPEIIIVILGDKWLLAIVPIQLLSLIVPLKALSNTIMPAVNGTGHPEVNARNMAVACVIMPVVFLIGIKWGLLGVSLGWVVGYTVWFAYMFNNIKSILGLSWSGFWKALNRPIISGVLMCLSIYLLRKYLPQEINESALSLAILVATGAIIYCSSMLIIGKELVGEVRDLMTKKAPTQESNQNFV